MTVIFSIFLSCYKSVCAAAGQSLIEQVRTLLNKSTLQTSVVLAQAHSKFPVPPNALMYCMALKCLKSVSASEKHSVCPAIVCLPSLACQPHVPLDYSVELFELHCFFMTTDCSQSILSHSDTSSMLLTVFFSCPVAQAWSSTCLVVCRQES